MAQILAFMDIAPFPSKLESLDKAAREWERGFGKMTDQVDNTEGAFGKGRRGAKDVAAQGEGIRPNRNQVSQAQDRARPIAEIGKTRTATDNGPGLSKKIRNAEESSQDPTAPVRGFDPNEPLRGVNPELDALEDERRRLEREAIAADRWEEDNIP